MDFFDYLKDAFQVLYRESSEKAVICCLLDYMDYVTWAGGIYHSFTGICEQVRWCKERPSLFEVMRNALPTSISTTFGSPTEPTHWTHICG